METVIKARLVLLNRQGDDDLLSIASKHPQYFNYIYSMGFADLILNKNADEY